MIRRKWIIGLLLAVAIVSLSACGKSKQNRPAPKRKSTQSQKPAQPQLPPEYAAIESESLKLYAGVSDWGAARTRLNSMRTEWGRLKGELKKTKVPPDKTAAVETHLQGIDTGITAQDRFKVSEQANELVGALQQTAGKYKAKVPPELILVQTDYREIRLHAADGNWAVLQELSKTAQQDWKKLKTKTKQVGGDAIGKNMEAYAKELDAAIKAKDAKKVQSVVGLIEPDLVTLRKSFENQPQAPGGENKGQKQSQ